LLLEAGLPINRLRDKLREHGISLSDLAGCLVSHEHGDHSKAVKDLLRAGVDVWMSEATAILLGSTGHHHLHMVSKTVFLVGDWFVQSFDLEHDAADPKGFFIGHGDEHLLFIPDTSFVKNRFEEITMIAIECNFQSDILTNNILSGALPSIVGRRVRRSHFSLENVISLLKANDLSRCRAIYLMHLSNGNSDERGMKEEIQAATGIPTYAL